MVWKIAEAKKKFSEMVHRAHKEPQIIFNRNRVVAVVVDPEEYEEFKAFRESRERKSLASVFDELRAICDEESYEIVLPDRRNREDQWPG
jgi:prevent-host-death family protein